MNSSWIRIALYAAVAVVAVGAGFLAHRSTLHPGSDATVRESSNTKKPNALPEVLPEFSLHDRAGEMRSIKSWQGKSLLINFWATWCGPCRREIPLLQKIQSERNTRGVQVIGVAVDRREDVLKFADEMKIGYPLLIGEQDALTAAESFGIQVLGFPFTVFTDAQGRVVTVHLGELTESQANALLDAVERVNRGELTPAGARAVAAEQLLRSGANPS